MTSGPRRRPPTRATTGRLNSSSSGGSIGRLRPCEHVAQADRIRANRHLCAGPGHWRRAGAGGGRRVWCAAMSDRDQIGRALTSRAWAFIRQVPSLRSVPIRGGGAALVCALVAIVGGANLNGFDQPAIRRIVAVAVIL